MKTKESAITMLLCLLVIGSFIPLLLIKDAPISHQIALEKKPSNSPTARNGLNFTEVLIEADHSSQTGKTIKVAQKLEFGKAFYLYNVAVYVKRQNTFPVSANMTLELQAVGLGDKPDETILYTYQTIDVTEGWYSIPIHGYYVSSSLFVVTYCDNSPSAAYYSMANNAGINNDERTVIDTGDGFSSSAVSWDQTMNVTVVWEEDMPELTSISVILLGGIISIALIMVKEKRNR